MDQTNISTYSALQLVLDEGLEQLPDHLEEEGLLDDVHLLQAQRHRLLDEGEQTSGEGRRQGLDLFHGEPIKVHHHHDTADLRDQLELSGQVDQVEDAEE